jgi:hypothetical protein
VEQFNQVIRVLKTPVTLILLLLFVMGAGYWSLQAVTASTTKASSQCVMTDVGKELTPKWVSVRVLNAGSRGGMAKETAGVIRAYGFNVIRINNSDREVTKTVIVGYAADSPEVLLVQQFFPGSITEGDGRADHVVDVLLGTEPNRAASPVTSIAVSGKLCLPAQTVSTASASASSSASPSPSASK